MVKEVRVSWEGLGYGSHSSFFSQYTPDPLSDDWETEPPDKPNSGSKQTPPAHTKKNSPIKKEDSKCHLADADWLKSAPTPSPKPVTNPHRKSA